MKIKETISYFQNPDPNNKISYRLSKSWLPSLWQFLVTCNTLYPKVLANETYANVLLLPP